MSEDQKSDEGFYGFIEDDEYYGVPPGGTGEDESYKPQEWFDAHDRNEGVRDYFDDINHELEAFEDEYSGKNDYLHMFDGDDEEEEEDDDEDDENNDSGDDNPQKSKNAKASKALSSGKDDTKPVNFDWLNATWKKMYDNPALKPICDKVNTQVHSSLSAACCAFDNLIAIIKPKYLTNTVGALLELLDDPLLNTLCVIHPKTLIDIMLLVPPVQTLLKQLKKAADPILNKSA